MTEELHLDTPSPDEETSTKETSGGFGRIFAFLALLGVAAALGVAVLRFVFRAKPTDPTTERIQSLIDEANRLLKELDDKKPA